MSTARLQELCKNNGGKLPAYAWPGGYTILYLDKDGEPLCATCATHDLLDAGTEDKPTTYDIYYEGPPVRCASCNAELESAYGDPDAQEDRKRG